MGWRTKTTLRNTCWQQTLFIPVLKGLCSLCLSLPDVAHSQYIYKKFERSVTLQLNGSWRISFSFFFLFQNLKSVPERDQCSSAVLSRRWWWRYTVKAMNQSQRSNQESRSESVRYWVCRWTFTESVYKVDKTSLTKLNSALHLCVFNQYNHY